ncbi:MAG: hypothetical protein U0360_04755 [Dehalococcoidia bacterium]
MTTLRLPEPSLASANRIGQAAGVGAVAVLLAGLAVRPVTALFVLWDVVIPVLPAVFVINPMLWRNVCPLATLNSLTGHRGAVRSLSGLEMQRWPVSVALLAILVPGRRFLFNEDGPALALTIAAVGVLALVLGLVYSRRAGFCNTICPVNPVEKLYGQAPLFDLTSARCSDCASCAPRGCIDLVGARSAMVSLGNQRADARWLASPFGVFVAAFPGFIAGYFTTHNGPLELAPSIYAHILAFAVASYLLTVVVTRATGASPQRVVRLSGALSVALYYGFSAPTLIETYAPLVDGPTLLRGMTVAAMLAWFLGLVPARRGVSQLAVRRGASIAERAATLPVAALPVPALPAVTLPAATLPVATPRAARPSPHRTQLPDYALAVAPVEAYRPMPTHADP